MAAAGSGAVGAAGAAGTAGTASEAAAAEVGAETPVAVSPLEPRWSLWGDSET